MKILSNKKTSILLDIGGTDTMYYSDFIKLIAATVDIKSGIDIIQMKQRMKIIDACDASKKKGKDPQISFEDTDFIAVKKMCHEHKWATVHHDVIMFIDDLDKVK